MEGDSENSEEDVQDEGKATVLWERCFQQSIIVELSEDESLHLSDLEASLGLHLSQAESAASEASIHLSGSAGMSVLDDTSSESNIVNSDGVSVQRPNTMNKERAAKEFEDAGQNTSDEDQEDLPFDGELGSLCSNQTGSSLGNSERGNSSQGSPEKHQGANNNSGSIFKVSDQTKSALPCPATADINHLLLRHFSQEELLKSGRLIEAETLPEVSLLESVDETVFSQAPTGCCTDTSLYNIAAKKESLEIETDNACSSISNTSISANRGKQERVKEINQVEVTPLMRTRSFTEMKYGQGQVHYPLPDFSKVAPKVKIPKTQSGALRSVPQSPGSIQRAQSSPGLLEVMSRVQEDSAPPPETLFVFEDSEKQSPSALVHHLQAEYDKLLTKYAEAENLLDQMRLGNNNKPSNEPILYSKNDDCGDEERQELNKNSVLMVSPRLPSESLMEKEGGAACPVAIRGASSVSAHEVDDRPSDGEIMTAELRDIVSHFMQKVVEFKHEISTMDVATDVQRMMVRSMLEAQDQLERKYIIKKEEHRALEMQNFMGLSRNTGTFDPNRLVEGDIFRIGMHLDDLKEMMDRTAYEQMSPPHSTSTPTIVTESQQVELLSLHTPSSPASVHEGQTGCLSTVICLSETLKKETKEEGEDSRFHLIDGSSQTSELLTHQRLIKNGICNINHSRNSLDILEGLHCQCAGNQEKHEKEPVSDSSEVKGHSDVLAHFNEIRSASGHALWSTDSSSGVINSNSECELDVNPAVEASRRCSVTESSVKNSCVSQRIISPETDSGFGSSYLSQSAGGRVLADLLTGSQSQSGGLDNSDSEGSCSNLETALHPPALMPRPSVLTGEGGASAAVELWVESTTKEPSVKLQREPKQAEWKVCAPPHHHVSEPLLSTSMDPSDRHGPLNHCSCNSKAILALQEEVMKLKRELQEGLVQLPHLAQKMDYLASSCSWERQKKRSETRSHQMPAPSRVVKSSSRVTRNLAFSPMRIEDWISSDLDLSKSKDSGSSDISCPEIMLQLHRSNEEYTTNKDGTMEKPILKKEKNWASEGLTKHRLKGELTSHLGFTSKDRRPPFSEPPLQNPLLQVTYGSSCSLPASYKLREPQMPSVSHHRKRSTQSDTALLPRNVFFQQTLSPGSLPPRSTSRTSRPGKREEEMNRTLDQAIALALSMKRTTDNMARRLSADLEKAERCRKAHSTQPPGGRKHQTL